jgi:hypothetical protein
MSHPCVSLHGFVNGALRERAFAGLAPRRLLQCAANDAARTFVLAFRQVQFELGF